MKIENQNDDQRLIALAKDGDETAFCEIYHTYYDWVYKRAYRVLKNHQDAEDATQDVFVKLWTKLDSYDAAHGSFKNWFSVVSKNCIINAVRDRDKMQRRTTSIDDFIKDNSDDQFDLDPTDPQPRPDRVMEIQEAQSILESAIVNLKKPKHRIAWVLHHLEGYSTAEVARILNRKQTTVKVWIYRCKDELQQILLRKNVADYYRG